MIIQGKGGAEPIIVSALEHELPENENARAEERRREQEEAARILGVKELVWLGVRDGELQPTLELRWKLVEIIRRFKPDLVMAPDPWLTYEAHPDHRHAGILASEAALFAPFPHAAPREGLPPHAVRYIAYYWTRKPNVFVDISGYVDAKRARASCARPLLFRERCWYALYSMLEYSLFFSLTFCLEKITFRLLNIEFIKP